MDLRMPGMLGTECVRQLKSIQPQLPIIMISGFDDPDTLAHAQEAGADAFWAKQISVGRFFEGLTVWLRRRKPGANETHVPANFLIAPTAETAEPPQTPVSLPAPPGPHYASTIQDQKRGAEPEQDLLPDEPRVCDVLNGMVVRLEQNLHTREDLLQEAWVHFWTMKRQHPGQRLNWYLQGVRFHLNDFRNSGRSVDALKRRGAQATFPDRCEEWDHWRDSLEFDEGFLSAVSSSDIFSLLVDRLKPLDRRILGELAEGLGACEIAVKWG